MTSTTSIRGKKYLLKTVVMAAVAMVLHLLLSISKLRLTYLHLALYLSVICCYATSIYLGFRALVLAKPAGISVAEKISLVSVLILLMLIVVESVRLIVSLYTI